MATRQDVSQHLAAITAPGVFATRRTAGADHLHLDVQGVGRIALPITKATARRLCAVARPARYGFKDQTRLDDRVRDTWEIPKSRIRIDQRAWRSTMRPLLDHIGRDLGLPDGATLEAELHNMLVYEPGQFFVAHQDSEKTDDMIGSLVVVLPSAYTGGEFVVEHHGGTRTFRGSGRQLTFIAFYADCHHHVRPIKTGYRVALTYHLTINRSREGTGSRVATPQVDALAQCIEEYFATPRAPRWAHDARREPPNRLVYLLDHQYTRRGLDWNRLKNEDIARVAALREVARRLDCEIFLALADVHESWSCEDEGCAQGHFGYHRSRYWDAEEDEDGDPVDVEALALIELLDSEIELRHGIGLTGRTEAVGGGIDTDEVCCTRSSSELEPFASEHEGYMGNWGNTVDRWYHRAAVVIWPRERTFTIRAEASPRWAVDEMVRALSAGKLEEARGMARRVVPFWPRVARREEGRAFLGRLLGAAAGLNDPALAACLLQPCTLERLKPTAAPRLVALRERYGADWCDELLARWAAADNGPDGARRLSWLAGLPDLCRSLRAHGNAAGLQVAQGLVTDQWAWAVRRVKQLREMDHPRLAMDAAAGMSNAILGLLDSCLIANEREVHGEMLRVLTSADTDYPVPGLVHLLRTAHETHARAALRDMGLGVLHRHGMDALSDRLAMPVREKGDWSIAAPGRCGCRLCGTLGRFLAASNQKQLDWPLAKDQRAHIHRIVDAHDLPVSHTTRRLGRPYTLVLVKTDALFEREAAERRSWQHDLIWLRKTAPAFRAGETPPRAGTKRSGRRESR